VIEIEAKLVGIENYMRAAGLYNTQQIRPFNEARMRARWRLGQLLAEIERGAGPGRGKKEGAPRPSFRSYIREIGLAETAAKEAQRIAALPESDLAKALARARARDTLVHFAELVDLARPYWAKLSRDLKHAAIHARATSAPIAAPLGPFPLIYADPPTKFDIYGDLGLERSPDRHYPTLTDEEIINFKIGAKTVPEIAYRDAALLMWSPSSNLPRALVIMAAWGFTFKTSAIWDKGSGGAPGLGFVFRNQHENLLYGTRGNMPAPQYQPPSVFRYPRGEHSAKPPEIRAEIEKMYPSYDARTRLELFARATETIPGWTCYGLEALAEGGATPE
jgi:N6-adenosine-specific RNA methylase IME4